MLSTSPLLQDKALSSIIVLLLLLQETTTTTCATTALLGLPWQNFRRWRFPWVRLLLCSNQSPLNCWYPLHPPLHLLCRILCIKSVAALVCRADTCGRVEPQPTHLVLFYHIQRRSVVLWTHVQCPKVPCCVGGDIVVVIFITNGHLSCSHTKK